MPFWKKKPSAPKPTPRFDVTELQVGDDAVCVNDEPNYETHQKLLVNGEVYKVREVLAYTDGGNIALKSNGYGGPWIRLVGIVPTDDVAWVCTRFKKALRAPPKAESIVAAVSKPAEGVDIEKEKAEAY